MNDATKIAVAIGAAGFSIAASVVYAAAMLAQRPAAVVADAPAGVNPPRTSEPGSSTPPAPRARRAPRPLLTQQDFSARWDGNAQDEAERKCFAPLEATGKAVNPNPYFHVAVDERGHVVEALSEHGPAATRLDACVAEVVRTLRFDEGSARRGFVQAARPQAPIAPAQ